MRLRTALWCVVIVLAAGVAFGEITIGGKKYAGPSGSGGYRGGGGYSSGSGYGGYGGYSSSRGASSGSSGTSLGVFGGGTSRYDPDSLANPYGAGSRYKSDGLMNPYSEYGSRYSNKSWRNPYATDAPRMYQGGKGGTGGTGGTYRGKLSTNRYDADSVSNPYGRYGSRYSPDSVRNPYGAGSRYSGESVEVRGR